MAQVGRISGPLLVANLERNGIDIAFRNNLDTTQLLYIDVNTGKIGVNRNAPLTELNIEGTAQSTILTSPTGSIANFNFNNNNIDNKSVNLSSLPQGLYLVKITSRDKSQTIKDAKK